jgi:Ni/Co efflux regulator RcnB
MKNVIATVTVLGLFALAPAASAQPDQHKQDEHKQGGAPAQGARPGGQQGPAGHAPDRSPGGPGGGHNGGPAERAPTQGPAPNAGAHNGPALDRSAGQGASRQGPNDRTRGEPTGGRAPERSPDRAGNAPNAGPRDVQQTGRAPNAGAAHRSPNVAALRGNVQSSRRFQAGAYRPPQGYQQRHWGYGDRLPRAYYARNYWLTNFLLYGLLSPPPGLVWVRVGPDALLVDEYSGEVVRVQYGVFY